MPAPVQQHILEFAGLLRTLAGPSPWTETPATERVAIWETFRDETGARPKAVEPLLAIELGISGTRPEGGMSADESLLWDLCEDRPEPSRAIRPGPGPLACEPVGVAQEMLAETELRALHAAGSMRGVDPSRIESAVAWHLEEIQPDNTTTRPWAVHVFWRVCHRSAGTDLGERCRSHVDMMLHACRIATGRPDTVSAMILRHAASVLDPASD